jgi:hypothetical protein
MTSKEEIERQRHSNWETTKKQLQQGGMWYFKDEKEGE